MLIDTVRQTIRAHDLIHTGDHIVLGLSGGPDSVCLFHVLQRLAAELDITIHPVHLNHQFRPGAAEKDQAYVEALCAKAGTPCRTFVVDCNAMAKELGMTSEEAGRKARYDAFVQVAEEVRTDAIRIEALQIEASSPDHPRSVIAVAQNANDQAETILHRILRGTGTDGLAGIAYQRDERGISVIRPLLDVPRTEIEAYCEENGLDPVTDHTNQEPIYTRNRIRLELLPELMKYNENIVAGLTRMGRIAAADKEYLWQQTETAYRQLRFQEETPGAPRCGDSAEKCGAPETPGASARSGKMDDRGAPTPPGAPDIGASPEIVLDRAGLAQLPEAIRHRVIARAFGELGLTSDIFEERLRAADAIIGRKQAPKTVEFPRGHRLTVKQGRVIFS